MTTDQLLAVLNEDAARLGAQPVTRRILRDWIDENLIGARTPKGRRRGLNPVWHFSENDVRWVRMIVELKAKNIRRAAELRLHLWVADNIYPNTGIAEALHSEFERLMKRHRRSLKFEYDHRDRRRLSEMEKEKFSKQLPPLDSDLANADFVLPRDIKLEMVSELLWGQGTKARSPIAGENLDAILGQLNFDQLAGIFGAPDEIGHSGEEQLAHISDDDLRQGRHQLIEAKSVLRTFQFLLSGNSDLQAVKMATAAGKAIRAFDMTEWIVSTLAAFSVQAFRARTAKGTRPTPQK